MAIIITNYARELTRNLADKISVPNKSNWKDKLTLFKYVKKPTVARLINIVTPYTVTFQSEAFKFRYFQRQNYDKSVGIQSKIIRRSAVNFAVRDSSQLFE